ncbi:hypothetical protein E8E12_008197 [Didymella heteroderae]|uniref:Uncharacterized protein n=1 Tax=Didymella heteroderae TaxID=1769908 RepID=A0A9P5C2Q7_9PLEO|nr:hypothetical protein E8E12_008197 [Didymella heteroderae]
MDPGMGLMVHSMVPDEDELPKLPSKSILQLPDGFLEKPHVRHALKYITDDEQRERALEIAMAWKRKFAAEKWGPIVAAIESARKEDNVRLSQDPDSPCEDDDIHPEGSQRLIKSVSRDNNMFLEGATIPTAERPRAMTIASAAVVPQATVTPWTARRELARQHTSFASLPFRRILAPLTPRRHRWDVITSGPVTPLSPIPSANSFTNWLRPKPAPPGEHTPVSTPVTAIHVEPGSPALLSDVETREVYNSVKKQIDSLARRHCLARFKARSNGCSDFIPATMVKPKDTLQAALAIMESHRVKLKEFIVKDLPDRLEGCVITEARVLSHLRIENESDLEQQNDWMNHISIMTASRVSDIDEHMDHSPEPASLAVSILDEQRAVLRDLRKQRESELAIRPEALVAAWAVKMLDDAECRTRIEGDDDSSSSSEGEVDHDEGYSYGNFLRAIKSEMSMSTSSGTLAAMVDEVCNSDFPSMRSRSSAYQRSSWKRIQDFQSPQQSSMSLRKGDQWSERLSGSTVLNTDMHTSSIYQRPDLSVFTKKNEEAPTGELSPEDREFRHRAPDLAELDHWAQELKKMEAMRVQRQRSPTLHRHLPTRGVLGGYIKPRSSTRQMSVDSINTPISPTRTMHSRFSSSSGSSASTNLLKPLPRPPFLKHSPSASFSTLSDSRPTMLDHEYHQRKMSKTSTHKRATSKVSMSDSVCRSQHLRASNTVQILAKHTSREVEDDWMGELKRMEGRERVRQAEERRTAQLLRGDTLVGEDVLNEGREMLSGLT